MDDIPVPPPIPTVMINGGIESEEDFMPPPPPPAPPLPPGPASLNSDVDHELGYVPNDEPPVAIDDTPATDDYSTASVGTSSPEPMSEVMEDSPPPDTQPIIPQKADIYYDDDNDMEPSTDKGMDGEDPGRDDNDSMLIVAPVVIPPMGEGDDDKEQKKREKEEKERRAREQKEEKERHAKEQKEEKEKQKREKKERDREEKERKAREKNEEKDRAKKEKVDSKKEKGEKTKEVKEKVKKEKVKKEKKPKPKRVKGIKDIPLDSEDPTLVADTPTPVEEFTAVAMPEGEYYSDQNGNVWKKATEKSSRHADWFIIVMLILGAIAVISIAVVFGLKKTL